jgi:hypothetical protein
MNAMTHHLNSNLAVFWHSIWQLSMSNLAIFWQSIWQRSIAGRANATNRPRSEGAGPPPILDMGLEHPSTDLSRRLWLRRLEKQANSDFRQFYVIDVRPQQKVVAHCLAQLKKGMHQHPTPIQRFSVFW